MEDNGDDNCSNQYLLSDTVSSPERGAFHSIPPLNAHSPKEKALVCPPARGEGGAQGRPRDLSEIIYLVHGALRFTPGQQAAPSVFLTSAAKSTFL